MDPYYSAMRQRTAIARQRLKKVWEMSSSRVNAAKSARMRHTQRPTGGGVSSNDARQKWDDPLLPGGEADTENLPGLRDILQSGANTTKSVLSDRMRRASEFTQKLREPRNQSTAWIVEPTVGERIKSHVSEKMPFAWRERARRRGYWRRRVMPMLAIALGIAVAFAVGYFALESAGHAAGALATTQQPLPQATTGGSVMISPLNTTDASPTPTAPQYTMGVWVSDTLPQGGTVTVYARVSNNAMATPNAKVYFHASTPNGDISIGPITTDAYGVASAPLNYGNVGSGSPINVSATTTIDGQTATGDTTFVTY